MGIPLGQHFVFIFLSFLFFYFWSFYPMIRGGILIYVYPDISGGYDFPLAQSNLFYRAAALLTSSYNEMIHG